MSIQIESTVPSEQDAKTARQVLVSLKQQGRDVRLHIHGESNSQSEIVLPASATQLLLSALEEIGKGNGVTLILTDAELTTQRAADLVRVSRPFFIKLLEAGKIPFRKVGAHRRILYRDVARYIQEDEERRVKVMEELVAETERLGLYE